MQTMDCLELARNMIAIDSVTSQSNQGIASLMRQQLERLSFEIEQIDCVDNHGLTKANLIARRRPLPTVQSESSSGGIVYCCHNDVVSVEGWNAAAGGPFDGAVADGKLWGRGACDMKGSAAAAMAAIANISHEQQRSPIYFLVTGDEESGMVGARTVAHQSKFFAEMVATGTVGVIGEPTELRVVNAHKGGCHFKVSAHGVAAHSSTADGRNANWDLIPFLSYLREQALRCDSDLALQNNRFSPATLSMNVVLLNEPAASNITVGKATCQIFLRPMPGVKWQEFAEEIAVKAEQMGLHVGPRVSLNPLYTPAESPFVQRVLKLVQQLEPEAVCYATDGCCLHQLSDLLVLGPGSIEQAHRCDEWISLEQLQQGVTVYERLFREFAC
jgi:acetylornithine deacetylase